VRTFPFTTKDGRRGVVREASLRDARVCLEIIREAVDERPRSLMTTAEEFWTVREWRGHMLRWSEMGVSLVAEVDRDVIGNLGIRRGERPVVRHTAELGLTVAAAMRGIGVGRALMATAEEWARENGIRKIFLGVFTKNDRARALYDRLGYEVEGIERRQARFPDGEEVDIVRMAKFLD
jgi:putative acetyltransferase